MVMTSSHWGTRIISPALRLKTSMKASPWTKLIKVIAGTQPGSGGLTARERTPAATPARYSYLRLEGRSEGSWPVTGTSPRVSTSVYGKERGANDALPGEPVR